MDTPGSRQAETLVPACATLVIQVAVDKREALAVTARAAGSTIENPVSVRARVTLPGGAWAEIDIPKFGEPPPLAIDVYSTADVADARAAALSLAAALTEREGWTVHPDFPV